MSSRAPRKRCLKGFTAGGLGFYPVSHDEHQAHQIVISRWQHRAPAQAACCLSPLENPSCSSPARSAALSIQPRFCLPAAASLFGISRALRWIRSLIPREHPPAPLKTARGKRWETPGAESQGSKTKNGGVLHRGSEFWLRRLPTAGSAGRSGGRDGELFACVPHKRAPCDGTSEQLGGEQTECAHAAGRQAQPSRAGARPASPRLPRNALAPTAPLHRSRLALNRHLGPRSG